MKLTIENYKWALIVMIWAFAYMLHHANNRIHALEAQACPVKEVDSEAISL